MNTQNATAASDEQIFDIEQGDIVTFTHNGKPVFDIVDKLVDGIVHVVGGIQIHHESVERVNS